MIQATVGSERNPRPGCYIERRRVRVKRIIIAADAVRQGVLNRRFVPSVVCPADMLPVLGSLAIVHEG